MSRRPASGVAARECRVIVVGGGVAGCRAAIAAAAAGAQVLLLTGGGILDSATALAQGGIAAAIAPGDHPRMHGRDTIAAGAGLCDPEAVSVLVNAGALAVRELVAEGMPFDRHADGTLAFGLEAAHSAARVLHAGGDASGRVLGGFLADQLAPAGVEVRERAFVRELALVDGEVVGVVLASGTILAADAVVLATGGLGALYPTTSNPAGAVGSGLLLAWRAGAQLADLEFVQFHPTTTVDGMLVSEAVRGAGAVLRDARGERFMLDVDARAELAPRDVVAAAAAAVIREQAGAPVYLDATGLATRGVRLEDRFPTIHRGLLDRGIDWRREEVPVAPAAHFSMGGIRVDLHGATTVPGLFAAGECASTGVHGANRLASNSLLEGLVFGALAGEAAARGASALREAPANLVDDPAVPQQSLSAPDGDSATAEREIAEIMRDGVGIERTRASLERAVAAFDAATASEQRAVSERARLGGLIARAALAREESRGAHRRTDFPSAAPPQQTIMQRGAAALPFRAFAADGPVAAPLAVRHDLSEMLAG